MTPYSLMKFIRRENSSHNYYLHLHNPTPMAPNQQVRSHNTLTHPPVLHVVKKVVRSQNKFFSLKC